ncbi:hypothetical protein [Streptomyces sp. 3N207]|uniref:hypothetical protein n=1 Tax=Streptomyces sp. 3N207 TaxID=3457417 RepID=UPI003FD14BAB
MTGKQARMRLWRAGCTAVVLLTAVAGCSDGDGNGHPGGKPAADGKPSGPTRPVHDPARTFASGQGVVLPEAATSGRLTVGGTMNEPPPVTLHKQRAFVAGPDKVQAVDTVTAKRTTVRPEGTALEEVDVMGDENPAQAPALTKSGDGALLVHPFMVEVTGTGTQSDHVAVEITGIDADTAKVKWRMPIQVPDWAVDSYSPVTATAHADKNLAAVTVSTDDESITYGVDLTHRRTVWKKKDFETAAVSGQTVVGLSDEGGEHERVVAYDMSSERRLWRGQDSYELSAEAAGPHLVAVHGRDYEDGDSYDRLLDLRSGDVEKDFPPDSSVTTCKYDSKSTVVCSGSGPSGEIAIAVDASSAKGLWELPDKKSDRIAPEVFGAWHGRVYGETKNGPVALDARSGKDAPENPRISPFLVNESIGVALDKSGDRLMAYPTAG